MPEASYGSWTSPLTARLIAGGATTLSGLASSDGRLYWSEQRPAEGGRTVVVTDSGDVTPPGFNVRTQVHEYGTGAALLGYTKLYGEVPGGQAEFLRVPQAHYGPIKVPEGPPDDRFVYLSDVLPTAWQAVEYANVPPGGEIVVLGLGPIGEMCTRIAQHRGAGQVIGVSGNPVNEPNNAHLHLEVHLLSGDPSLPKASTRRLLADFKRAQPKAQT